jgi:hypothetical protein
MSNRIIVALGALRIAPAPFGAAGSLRSPMERIEVTRRVTGNSSLTSGCLDLPSKDRGDDFDALSCPGLR